MAFHVFFYLFISLKIELNNQKLTCPLSYQELASLGLSSTCLEAGSPVEAGLNAVPALNAMFELLQVHQRNMRLLEELEKEQLKKSSTLEHVQMNNSRLKACITAASTSISAYCPIVIIFFNYRSHLSYSCCVMTCVMIVANGKISLKGDGCEYTR